MGFLSNFWNGIKRAFGIRPKQEPPKELPPLPPDTVKISDFKQAVKPEITQEQKIDDNKIEIPQLYKPHENLRYNDIKKKQDKFFSKFHAVSEREKADWQDAINPAKVAINTGFYGSHADLVRNKFDIYRNIILANIRDDQMVQNIYQSGYLNNRIVGIIKLRLVYISNGKPVRTGDATFEMLGLTPDIAERANLHDELTRERYKAGFQQLKNKIEELTGLKIDSAQSISESEVEVIHVQIGFNYA